MLIDAACRPPARQGGFNLIELMVVIAIMGLLLATGLPLVTEAIRDSRIRGAAESVVAGLRITQSEALKRNGTFRFQLMTSLSSTCALSTTGPVWIVSRDAAAGKCDVSDYETAPFPMRRDSSLGTGNVTIEADGNGAFCYSGLGRPTTAPAGCNSTLGETYEVKATGLSCKADGGAARCLRVVVSPTGTIRMCDPAVTSTTDPRLC